MPNKLPPKEHRFKKGQSGNPKGRPKGSFSMTKKIREMLEEEAKDGETYGDKLKKAAILRAISKSDKLMTEIWDRMDGKVPTDITSGGERVQFIVPTSIAKKNGITPSTGEDSE